MILRITSIEPVLPDGVVAVLHGPAEVQAFIASRPALPETDAAIRHKLSLPARPRLLAQVGPELFGVCTAQAARLRGISWHRMAAAVRLAGLSHSGGSVRGVRLSLAWVEGVRR